MRRNAAILHFMIYLRIDHASAMACCNVREGAATFETLGLATEYEYWQTKFQGKCVGMWFKQLYTRELSGVKSIILQLSLWQIL